MGITEVELDFLEIDYDRAPVLSSMASSFLPTKKNAECCDHIQVQNLFLSQIQQGLLERLLQHSCADLYNLVNFVGFLSLILSDCFCTPLKHTFWR